MEFEAATATLSKKLSNGCGVSGKSAYDGVFATPIKFRAPTLSSRFEDYSEIFVVDEASLGSSIPILEVPALNERKILDNIRCSKLDYSKVFGGFGNLDNAEPYEELLAQPKKNDSFPKGAWSAAKEGNNYWKEIPLESQESSSFNGVKNINMSDHKINQGNENRRNGTMHIAQLHAIPADSCSIEQVNPPKMNKADISITVAHDAYHGSHCKDGIKESDTKSFPGPSIASAKKQSSNGGVKVHNRSDSIHQFFDACEISHGSDETQYIKVALSETVVSNMFNHNDDVMRSMVTKYQVSKNDASGGDVGADSPPSYLDDTVHLNSEAAASVAALRKAIEEAQERIKVVKESMKRKKETFPDHVKRNNNDFIFEGKKEVKFAYKTLKLEETTLRKTFVEMDTLLQVCSEIRKPMMRSEQVTPDHTAKSNEAEVKEEAVLEFKETENNKRVLHGDECQSDEKCTGSNAIERAEQSGQTTEVVEGAWEQETNEGKLNAVDEVGGCQELVDETKFVQVAHDYGAREKRLNVEENEDIIEKKANPCDEMEDWERKLSEQVLTNIIEKKIACKSEEYEEKIEESCELKECETNSRAHQEPVVFEKKIGQEQKEFEKKIDLSSELEECVLRESLELIDNEKMFSQHGLDFKSTERQIEFEKKVPQELKECEKVNVYSELEECELRELLEPIDNEKALSSRGLDLRSTERQIEKLACTEDGKKSKGPDCLDIIQEIEHFCQSEGIENMFGNTYIQEMLENIMDHLHNEEEIHERITKDSESNGNERVQDTKETEKEIEGATFLMEENEREWKDNSEWLEVLRMTQTGPNYKGQTIQEADKTIETSRNYEPDETQNINKIHMADTNVKNDETPEVTAEVYAHDELHNIKVDNSAFKHEENYREPESVQETNYFGENHILGTSALTQGALEFNETVNQMQSTNETVPLVCAAKYIGEFDIKVHQNQCLKEGEHDYNLAKLVEEPTPESLEIFKDAKESEVALNEEIDVNQYNSFAEEKVVDSDDNIEASQLPSWSEWEDQEIKTSLRRLKNHQATPAMEEKKANGSSQKVDQGKEHLKKVDEAKEREREREREKLAVERVILEARERAFAEAQERAAQERAAAEARQKNISDGREKLGKNAGLTNERTPSEKAAIEAKLKAGRAAVERATAEARARALERALSEKAASERRDKSDKFVAEKSFTASRDNDVFDGTNADSAQRCKARSERHQRIGERVAKALAEKNLRDRLVQKEQDERNRVAESQDADVKRWSNGKEGNLRALLSTLHYILGPDSGWKPIPLTEILTSTAVKKAYRKATLSVHPDKLQQRGASIQQKYMSEKVFDLLKEAWNRFNMDER